MAAPARTARARTAAGPAVGDPRTLDRETFGQRLRTARRKYGWTLAEVSERSGVSVPTISRAERGQLALSYEKFSALARALNMDIGAMFAEAGGSPRSLDQPVVTRANQGVRYRGLAFTYEFLGTQAAGKQMSPILGTVHARAIQGPGDFARHEGEEFMYVLSGKVEVHFDTGEVFRLAKGDSLYFDSRIGHAYISTGPRLARILGATTGESSLMRLARERESGTAGPARRNAK
ncbi:XRE family transcriptional regulator [Ramlibacter tataouinensis]|uniref:helix-turn-helix domain-containing protein n=1 Tax=Ramlibacter tataouinensis TaxID=94132 RepID=UPI0022F38476|nr:XRE family transcriptional regulator [Ramlibacter tataouinensis]WBY03565.1 XRE family transcriptional regulator [Ramlibacter tataouinensis]